MGWVFVRGDIRSSWRGVRVAEGAAFEMRCAGDRTGGSNPPLSDILRLGGRKQLSSGFTVAIAVFG